MQHVFVQPEGAAPGPANHRLARQSAKVVVPCGKADIFENNFGNVLATPQTQGERIRIEGRVLDGIGTPVRDVLLEIWQANAAGRYNHPGDRQPGNAIDPRFRGWARGVRLRDRRVELRDHQAGRGDGGATAASRDARRPAPGCKSRQGRHRLPLRHPPEGEGETVFFDI